MEYFIICVYKEMTESRPANTTWYKMQRNAYKKIRGETVLDIEIKASLKTDFWSNLNLKKDEDHLF